MTYKDIKNLTLREDHTALCQGYVSRKLDLDDCPVEPYKGRFGVGYKLYEPNFRSTTYCYVTYLILEEEV